MFGLYKRFHTHTDGKGLGLYLVKLQIESLGGSVEVQSKPDSGSNFKVTFKEPVRAEGQVVYESDFGSVIYNARINCTSVSWKGLVPSEEYRFAFMKCVDIVRTYHTPFWISDLSDRGSITPEDQQWVISTMMPEAVRYGLRKVATVSQDNLLSKEYFERLEKIAAGYGIEIKSFANRTQAEEWIESFVEAPAL